MFDEQLCITFATISMYTILYTQLVPGQYHQTTIEVVEGIKSEELKPGQKLVQTADTLMYAFA